MNKRKSLELTERILDDMVKKGYLKKTPKGYVDSDRVKRLLKAGKSREQIDKMIKKN